MAKTMADTLVTFLSVLCLVHVQSQAQEVLIYPVLEESPPNTPIVNISTAINVADQTVDSDSIRFSIDTTSTPYGHLFDIEDSQYGELRTAQVLDREDTCAYEEQCYLPVDIVVLPMYDIIKIEVEVLDINDNSPVFSSPDISRSVTELSDVGALISLDTATDRDSPRFGVQSYQLSASETFDLLQSENARGQLEVSLVLKERVDHEEQEVYSVQLTAYDGNPATALSATTTVEIKVLDANDNPPVFTRQEYSATVVENSLPTEPLVQVQAEDLDTGVSGQIVYSFDSQTQRDYGQLFALTPDTGDLMLSQALDHETRDSYVLLVEAANPDSSASQAAAVAQVTVTVQDVNDNDPVMTFSTFTEDGRASVSESRPVGTFVARLSVADPDSGDNGQFTCQMNSDHFELERQAYPTEFRIVTKASLNREAASLYQLICVCTDGGTPARAATNILEVHILDDNDNAPVFDPDSYVTNFKENARLGTSVAQLHASDQDDGMNSNISYQLLDRDMAALFQLDGTSGTLTVAGVLDYERYSQLEVQVMAIDGGSPPLNATATVLVTLEDEDDESPVFDEEMYSLSVYENVAVDSELSQPVTATDKDSDKYNTFTYSIDPSSRDGTFFAIDETIGRITTKTVFDRELQAVYRFQVRAIGDYSREGEQPRSGTAQVTVYIVDKNDHSPVITYPATYNNTVYVKSKSPIGKLVTVIRAHDEDGGPNGQLSYFIRGGNQDGYFLINEQNGVVSVNKSLHHAVHQSFQVLIEVADHGDARRSEQAILEVMIQESQSDGVSNLTIVLVIVGVGGVVIIFLVIAIALLLCKAKRGEERSKYSHMAVSETPQPVAGAAGLDGDMMYAMKPRHASEASQGYINSGLTEDDTSVADSGRKETLPPVQAIPEYQQAVLAGRHSPFSDKDSDSGYSAEMSHHSDTYRLSHQSHQAPPLPPKGVSRSGQRQHPPLSPVSTATLPVGVHFSTRPHRTPSYNSDITGLPYASQTQHTPYRSFNQGHSNPRPIVSMDTREFGQKYGSPLKTRMLQPNNSIDVTEGMGSSVV